VIPNVPDASSANTPPQEIQPHVDPSPSLPIESSSLSSSSPSETFVASNQVDKKKKKRNIKKKKNKQGAKLPTNVRHVGKKKTVTLIRLGVLMMLTSLPK
jgi:hypothetical protein